jgi:hypothetical protein
LLTAAVKALAGNRTWGLNGGDESLLAELKRLVEANKDALAARAERGK